MFFRLPTRVTTLDHWFLWRVLLYTGLYLILLTPSYSTCLHLKTFWPLAKAVDYALAIEGYEFDRGAYLIHYEFHLLYSFLMCLANMSYLLFMVISLGLMWCDAFMDCYQKDIPYEELSYASQKLRWMFFMLSILNLMVGAASLFTMSRILLFITDTTVGERRIPYLPHLMQFTLLISQPFLRVFGVEN